MKSYTAKIILTICITVVIVVALLKGTPLDQLGKVLMLMIGLG